MAQKAPFFAGSRVTITSFQRKTVKERREGEKINANITMYRTETEAVLGRHHLVLETPEAKEAR